MDYSLKQLDEIKELASCLTSISDIAVLLDLDLDTFRCDLLDRKSDVSKTYHKAKASTALKLRKQELELANVGSPLAVGLVNSYLLDMNSDEDL